MAGKPHGYATSTAPKLSIRRRGLNIRLSGRADLAKLPSGRPRPIGDAHTVSASPVSVRESDVLAGRDVSKADMPLPLM